MENSDSKRSLGVHHLAILGACGVTDHHPQPPGGQASETTWQPCGLPPKERNFQICSGSSAPKQRLAVLHPRQHGTSALFGAGRIPGVPASALTHNPKPNQPKQEHKTNKGAHRRSSKVIHRTTVHSRRPPPAVSSKQAARSRAHNIPRSRDPFHFPTIHTCIHTHTRGKHAGK